VAAPRQGLITAQHLTPRTRQEIEALVRLCKQHEPIDLPLLLDPDLSPESDENLYFLFYDDDTLIGAASTWPGLEIEAIGAVHPQHRRQRVGSALLNALREEGQRRGVQEMLLVCEKGAPSGAAFSTAMGAQYTFGEYRMKLDRALYAQCAAPPQTLTLRHADTRDLDVLVALWTASSDVSESEARERTHHWLRLPSQRFYVGWLEDRAIGSVRLHLAESSVYLNSFRVHPDLRGRGYGRQILVGVLDALIAEDWPHIMIEVATDNTVALALYRSCGFREVAAYQYYHLAIEPL
jgi:ribosomal protein S18 acetylase RimI-like enzyme